MKKIAVVQGAVFGVFLFSLQAHADIVHLDDVIIDGSLCVGQDCVNGESFGFDTLRLKENNLRIKFEDTSNSASFPTNDWQLTANDSSNGGKNKFSIDDIDGGRTPFTVEAGARSNALYVKSTGRIGIGTDNPVADLHVKNGNTPTLRLEQDGSSGFTAQTWDLAGNEANFFIRDATNGSKLPFKIKPNAPNNSIYIAADGKIGMGTQSPGFALDIQRTSENAAVVAQRSDGATIFMNATATRGNFGTTSAHPVGIMTNTTVQFLLGTDGNITMTNGGGTYTNGSWVDASSRELKENIQTMKVDEAMSALTDLTPVTYNYKADKEEARAGFIAEDVPAIVATKDRKTLSSMDIVAVLTKVVQQQQKLIEELQLKVDTLSQQSNINKAIAYKASTLQ